MRELRNHVSQYGYLILRFEHSLRETNSATRGGVSLSRSSVCGVVQIRCIALKYFGVFFVLKAPTSARLGPLPPPLAAAFAPRGSLKFCGRNCTRFSHMQARIIPRVISTCSLESLFFICLSLPCWLQLSIHLSNPSHRTPPVMNEWSRSSCFHLEMHLNLGSVCCACGKESPQSWIFIYLFILNLCHFRSLKRCSL